MLLPPGRVRIDVDLVSTAINAAVIAAVGILLGRQAKGRFDGGRRTTSGWPGSKPNSNPTTPGSTPSTPGWDPSSDPWMASGPT
jgi:hypothetical protein